MSIAGRFGAALLVALLGGCAGVEISSTHDPSVDFSTLKSYEWMPAQQEGSGHPRVDDAALDAGIRAAVERELDARGREKRAAHRADFLIGYSAVVVKKRDERIIGSRHVHLGSDTRTRYVDSGRELRIRTLETQVVEYHQGSLILSFHDPESMQVLWRGTGVLVVDFELSPEESAKNLDELIRQLLERFPPASKS